MNAKTSHIHLVIPLSLSTEEKEALEDIYSIVHGEVEKMGHWRR